jgi:hypothetical protein
MIWQVTTKNTNMYLLANEYARTAIGVAKKQPEVPVYTLICVLICVLMRPY